MNEMIGIPSGWEEIAAFNWMLFALTRSERMAMISVEVSIGKWSAKDYRNSPHDWRMAE